MMLAPERISCFWPGLAWAWWRGSARGLLAAVGFGWALCVLLLATFVWPNWFPTRVVGLLWFALLIYWVVEIARSNWSLKRLHTAGLSPGSDDRFARAQLEYLRGNWFEAESLLLEIIRDAPRDAESQLLLVGVLRHCRRWSSASRRLDALESLETAARWRFEIQSERKLIERLRKESKDSQDQPSDVAETPAAEVQGAETLGELATQEAGLLKE